MQSEQVELWFDTNVFEGCIALYLALPQVLPIADGLTMIDVRETYLLSHSAGPDAFDHDWMQLPFNCLVYWQRLSDKLNPVVHDGLLARRVLRLLTNTRSVTRDEESQTAAGSENQISRRGDPACAKSGSRLSSPAWQGRSSYG